MTTTTKATANMRALLGFCATHSKDVGLLALLLSCIGFALYKATPPFVPKVLELKISKNRTDIKQLSQPRDITTEKTVFVDKLMLLEGSQLAHPKLGALGFDSNFFIDIESTFTVKKAGDYIFYPGSDDGFALYLDGKLLCQFQDSRPYQVRSCRTRLSEGSHRLKMSYYQGYGHSGLTLAYRAREDDTQRWYGEESKYISFN